MNNDVKQAGVLTFLAMAGAVVLLVVAVVVVLLWINTATQPSGLALSERARQAQIDRTQAETAKLLAEASKTQAEGKAVEVTAWSEALVLAVNAIVTLLLCGAVPIGAIFILWLIFRK